MLGYLRKKGDLARLNQELINIQMQPNLIPKPTREELVSCVATQLDRLINLGALNKFEIRVFMDTYFRRAAEIPVVMSHESHDAAAIIGQDAYDDLMENIANDSDPVITELVEVLKNSAFLIHPTFEERLEDAEARAAIAASLDQDDVIEDDFALWIQKANSDNDRN